MKTIYLDISSLLNFPFMTGIQRVLTEVTNRLISKQNEMGYKVVLLRHNRDYNFSLCDNDIFLMYYSMSKGRKESTITSEAITIDELEPSSIWLDLDAVWNSLIPRNLLYPRLAKRNIKIAVYVYDVIALTNPEYTSAENHIRFPAYMGAVFDYADYVFTEAEFTKEEIKRLAKTIGCERPIQYCVAAPGANFNGSNYDVTKVDRKALEIADRGNILLTVSTIEIRKNHTVLLDAFDKGLFEMGYQMVFVGKAGWKVDKVLDRIKKHPKYDRGLFHLQGVNDDTLNYLYRHASFVLFPSYIEGYGMATVEALQYGIPTILSDIPIMHEVGGNLCDYFSPNDPNRLVNIVKKYKESEELYNKKCELLKKYNPPTWDKCCSKILEKLLSNQKLRDQNQTIEQMVYLSARPDDLLETLPYVEKFMPFIKRIVVLCPESKIDKLMTEYKGNLKLKCISDDILLNGSALPKDHAKRNFYLRCLSMSRKEIDEIFIMSDDDYRPIEEIDITIFIKDNKYQAYYFYDLDEWPLNIAKPTSYDIQMYNTNRFLKENGYPNLQYASHMPQVVRKDWYLEMLNEYPGLELEGCDEWSTYFNYSIHKYPEQFDVRSYITMSWPEMLTSWDITVFPKKFAFENYYDFKYKKDGSFEGLNTNFNNDVFFDSAKKIAISKDELKKVKRKKQSWRDFENRYSTKTKQFPCFVFCFGDGIEPKFANLPQEIELLNACAYSLPVALIELDETGRWILTKKNVKILYQWEGYEAVDISENMFQMGRACVRIMTPGKGETANLLLYYQLNEGDPIQTNKIRVKLRR